VRGRKPVNNRHLLRRTRASIAAPVQQGLRSFPDSSPWLWWLFVSETVKDFFVLTYPPGGREKDNRKRKLVEEEKIRKIEISCMLQDSPDLRRKARSFSKIFWISEHDET